MGVSVVFPVMAVSGSLVRLLAAAFGGVSGLLWVLSWDLSWDLLPCFWVAVFLFFAGEGTSLSVEISLDSPVRGCTRGVGSDSGAGDLQDGVSLSTGRDTLSGAIPLSGSSAGVSSAAGSDSDVVDLVNSDGISLFRLR